MDTLNIVVGLPLDAGEDVKNGVKRTFLGRHQWQADGIDNTLQIDNVLVASQPVGGLFDWLLDDDGQPQADKKVLREKEIGIIGIGMNTVDLLVVDHLAPVERFTGGSQAGVRRLLELSNTNGLYTIAEMDEKLRAGKLDTSSSLPVWRNEVAGFIDRQWGNNWRRFSAIVVVGGGSILLHQDLTRKFGLLAQFQEDPVLSTARGLYKFASKKLDNCLAFDAGYGSVKVYGRHTSIVMPAAVSSNGSKPRADLAGLKKARRPLHIESAGGSFYVGAEAHKFGRPVQSLDLDRLTGPEMLALFYGSLSHKG